MEKLKYLTLLTVALLVGCASPSAAIPTESPPTAEVAAVVAEEPTVPPPTDTATPLPTATTQPTETALPTATLPPTETPRPTRTPRPEPTATPIVARFSTEGMIVVHDDQVAVSNDNLGPSGTQFTDPGGAVFHDGQYHMFHNAFTGWPVPVDVMYSVSDDGLNWELVQEEPVFVGNDLPYAGVAALASSVVVSEEGTWMMYFYTWDDPTWPVGSSQIGLATAPAPAGPWTALPEPVLEVGAAGEWDSLAVRTPSVQKVEDGYLMFYSGHTRNSAAIGQAFSSDGIRWAKFDDPDSEDAPYRNSDPIFTGSGAGWDAHHVYQPRLQITADGWVMLYTSARSVSGPSLSQNHGLALSQDGVEWIRSETPIVEPNEFKTSGRQIWFTEMTFANETYTVFVELGAAGETEIYAATFESDALP